MPFYRFIEGSVSFFSVEQDSTTRTEVLWVKVHKFLKQKENGSFFKVRFAYKNQNQKRSKSGESTFRSLKYISI